MRARVCAFTCRVLISLPSSGTLPNEKVDALNKISGPQAEPFRCSVTCSIDMSVDGLAAMPAGRHAQAGP